MKFYLSSYKIGDKKEKLLQMIPQGTKLGLILNAIDYLPQAAREKSIEKQHVMLHEAKVPFENLDLQQYFGKQEQLQKKLDELGGVWIRGGNTFVLRQAMKLSGFDEIITSMDREDFLYAGYSAGICILAPTLDGLQIVDNPKEMPYPQLQETLMDGLGILSYLILPHYKSDHPESADVDKEVEYCKNNDIPFKTLRDGEVIIIEPC